MTTTINASTTAGLVSTADTSGALALQTAGTTAVTIDTSQNVGIGTSSPLAILDVASSSNPAVRIRNTSTGGAGIWFVNSTSGTTTGDGSNVGIDSSQQLNLWNYENTATLFATNNSERMRIDSSGNLLVGTTTAVGKLTVTDAVDRGQSTAQFAINGNGYVAHHFLDSVAYSIGQNSASRNLKMYSGTNSGTGVQLAAGGTSWGTYSDERIKTGLAPIENALTKVSTLRAVTGRYNTDENTVSRAFLIAQDVKAVLPEAVDEERDELKTLTLKYTDVIPLLVASIKELKAINDTQAEKINALTARVVNLESK